MSDVKSIGFALDPTNIPSFLLDWELTKLCNLDCSYCPTGIEWGSHDNSTKHPLKEECIKSIDFMYEYVDLYMQHKKPSQRKVLLNVYGGESLFHPDIVEILQACKDKHKQYQDRWYLTITCTTNAIVGDRRWEEVIPLIDNFTLSYHSESLPKQKDIFKTNTLRLKEINKPFRVAMVMHNNKQYWDDCVDMIEWFKANDVNYTAKPLDNPEPHWSYTPEQFSSLKTFWISKVSTTQKLEYIKTIDKIGIEHNVQSIAAGRACCGGRKLSLNGDLKSSVSFVPRQGFEGWSCSVNWFFLYVQQLTGNVYTNKDCRTSTTGLIEPLGNVSNSKAMINTLRTQLETKTMPIITCIKEWCACGYCAPKAESRQDFLELIRRNVPVDLFQKNC